MEQRGDDIFSKLDRSQEGRSKDMGSKKGERVTICRKNRPVDGAEHDLVTEIDDLLLPGTSSFADTGFSGFPRPSCSSEPSRACLHAPAYTYNNVTHTPRVRLFLLFRPVARGACSRARGWFRQSKRDVSDCGDKRDESQGCGTRTIISLDSLRKRFVKLKSRKLYRHAPLFRLYEFFFLCITR